MNEESRLARSLSQSILGWNAATHVGDTLGRYFFIGIFATFDGCEKVTVPKAWFAPKSNAISALGYGPWYTLRLVLYIMNAVWDVSRAVQR